MLPRDQSAMRAAYYTAVRDKLVTERALRAAEAELERVRTRLGALLANEDMHIGRAIAALCERAMAAEGGHQQRAAHRLGVSPSTLWRWRQPDLRPQLSHYKIPQRYRVAKLKLVQEA